MIVEIVPVAEAELQDAVRYYESQRPGLGVEFAAAVEEACRNIKEYPRAWQKVSGGARRSLLRRFEYGLIYRVRGGVATIYAVMHLKRRPDYWRDRLKPRST